LGEELVEKWVVEMAAYLAYCWVVEMVELRVFAIFENSVDWLEDAMVE